MFLQVTMISDIKLPCSTALKPSRTSLVLVPVKTPDSTSLAKVAMHEGIGKYGAC